MKKYRITNENGSIQESLDVNELDLVEITPSLLTPPN
jgi:hypothetical protein